ncbi:unnamed protein product [Peniophora sp. CBMAI 1063]|nr:unnamed protein product [Peniophora sp. CBMAI 1063]
MYQPMASRVALPIGFPVFAERSSLVDDFDHGEPDYFPRYPTWVTAYAPLSFGRECIIVPESPVSGGRPLPSPPSDALLSVASSTAAAEPKIKIVAPLALYNNIRFVKPGANEENRRFLMRIPAGDADSMPAATTATRLATSAKPKAKSPTTRPCGSRKPAQKTRMTLLSPAGLARDVASAPMQLLPAPGPRVALSPRKNALPSSAASAERKTAQKSRAPAQTEPAAAGHFGSTSSRSDWKNDSALPNAASALFDRVDATSTDEQPVSAVGRRLYQRLQAPQASREGHSQAHRPHQS